jgi:hypothetical protein
LRRGSTRGSLPNEKWAGCVKHAVLLTIA